MDEDEKIGGDAVVEDWPALPLAGWRDTCDTLHLWTQVVGKVLLARRPFLNEWWQVAMHLGPRGLVSGAIPNGPGAFGMDFDFLADRLVVATSEGDVRAVELYPRSVADFHAAVRRALAELGIDVEISTRPVEFPGTVPFERDTVHASYDPAQVRRWWRIVLRTAAVLDRWRACFVGKSSPVHFFWGSFDLTASRFSGRPAPLPAGPRFFQLAEDQENFSCGFWPGNTSAGGVTLGEPAFYAYIYPAPAGFDRLPVGPEGATFHRELGEWILPYEAVRRADAPEERILAFFQSAYEACADLARWDRRALEGRP